MKEKENKTEIIYQYYSLNTFDSIIKNRELWFSDIKKMNDINEDKEIFIFLKKELNQILNEIKEERQKNKYYKDREDLLKEIEKITFNEKRFKKHFLEIKKYSLKIDNKKLKNLKKERNKIGFILLAKNFQKLNKFISCFSREGDLLGQWRSYADNGKGIVIGYNLDELKKIFKFTFNEKTEILENTVNIKEVEYLDENNINRNKILSLFDNKKIREFDSIIDELLDDLDSQDEAFKKYFIELLYNGSFDEIITLSKEITPEEKIVWERLKKIYTLNEEISPFFKHYGFKEEKEIRILLNKKDKEDMEEKEKTYISRSNFRISPKKDDFIEYIKLVMNELDFKKVVSEIIIGPNNNINEEYMKNILIKYGFNVEKIKIKKSTIPYKN